jgi:hypothetical protein
MVILNKFDLEQVLLDEAGYPDVDYITRPNAICADGLCFKLGLGETGKDPMYNYPGDAFILSMLHNNAT